MTQAPSGPSVGFGCPLRLLALAVVFLLDYALAGPSAKSPMQWKHDPRGYPEDLPIEATDEVGDLARSLNMYRETVITLGKEVIRISQGSISATWNPR